MVNRLLAWITLCICTLQTAAQNMESTLDIITLAEIDGEYTVSKTNSDTAYTIVLDSSIVIKRVLERYRSELANAGSSVDIHTPFTYVLAPIYPLAEQVLVYRSGDFTDFVIEALSPNITLSHENWKQHDYLIKDHSFYYGTSIPSHTACVAREVQGHGTAIVVEAADSIKRPSVILARDIRDNFGGAVVDTSDPDLAKTTTQDARIVHLGPVAELRRDGVYLDRRINLQAEIVTYLSEQVVDEAAIDHLLSTSIKAMLVAEGRNRIKANQWMVNKYYKQLFDGDRKHDALARSIRDYIRNVSGVDNAHPYYWTAIRQYGDIKSIDGNVPSRLYWILILIMIALFVMLRKSGGRLY